MSPQRTVRKNYQAPGFSKIATPKERNPEFSSTLGKYCILHSQNPLSRPQDEWSEVALLGPQVRASPYSHEVIQPQQIYMFLKHDLMVRCEPGSQSTGENTAAE